MHLSRVKIMGILLLALIFPMKGTASAMDNLEQKPRVLVVGGGIAGLCAAKALENIGLIPDTIEKRQDFAPEGAGIALPANAAWALQQLGLEKELDASALHINAMDFMDDQNNNLAHENITSIHNAGTQFMAIDRASLHELLLGSLKTPIKMSTTVTKLTDTQTGVEVCFNNGETKTYDLVIGADGIHSQVRHLLKGEETLDYKGLALWRTIVKTPEGLVNPVYMLGLDRVLLLYPLNNENTYVYGHVIDKDRLPENAETRLSRFKTLFQDFKGYAHTALEQITDPEQLISGWLDSSPSLYWGNGSSVLLIGDARAAFSPMLQQGGAQAMEDAYVLGESLKLVLAGECSISEAVAQFIKRRNDRVQSIMTQSDSRIKAFTAEEAAARAEYFKTHGAPNVAAFKVFMQENP